MSHKVNLVIKNVCKYFKKTMKKDLKHQDKPAKSARVIKLIMNFIGINYTRIIDKKITLVQITVGDALDYGVSVVGAVIAIWRDAVNVITSIKYKLSKHVILMVVVSACASTSVNAVEKSKFYSSGSYGIGFTDKFQFEHIYQDGLYLYNKPSKIDVLGLAVGYGMTDDIRVELGYNRFNDIKYKSDAGSDINDDGVSDITYSTHYITQKQKAETIFGTIFYDINKFDKIKPFLSIGAGISLNKSGDMNSVSREYRNMEKISDSVEKNFFSKTTSNMSWKLGAGINYEICKKFDLNLINYQYNNLGKMITKADGEGKAISNKLQVHSISTSIIFKWN